MAREQIALTELPPSIYTQYRDLLVESIHASAGRNGDIYTVHLQNGETHRWHLEGPAGKRKWTCNKR